MSLSRYWRRYTQEECQLLLEHMVGTDKNTHHRDVLKRCAWISENILFDRTPEGLREKWYLIERNWSDVADVTEWESDIKDVADLLDSDQRRRINYKLPRIKKYVDPRVKPKTG